MHSTANSTNTVVRYTALDTPIGVVTVTSDGSAITGVYMETHQHSPGNRTSWVREPDHACAALAAARTQLAEYFDGARLTFELSLSAMGTDMQKSVWHELARIPFGETRSYGEIAAALGNPKASRAVGAANGRNPIAIIVPCHRVIGADGSLTGFGGGVERKAWLLAHEARVSGLSGFVRASSPPSTHTQR
jgi:methylated-DNA-[protein]-cysteine S-methyltransferase